MEGLDERLRSDYKRGQRVEGVVLSSHNRCRFKVSRGQQGPLCQISVASPRGRQGSSPQVRETFHFPVQTRFLSLTREIKP